MGVSTSDLFGHGGGDGVAAPGTYGKAPPGFRLPDDTRLGRVRLQIADLSRSVSYYENVLGMRVIERHSGGATLGPQQSDGVLVEVLEHPGARPVPRRGQLGLYHFAILLPDRAALGRFVTHLDELGIRAGAADHLVSEALYLQDPDGLGIEVYADRPRASWRRIGRELMMSSDPIDLDGVVRSARGETWAGMPAATVMGHVHLHVGDLDEGGAFFSDALGFDRVVWRYPGALFLSAGGYHHHLGTNVWAGPGARPPGETDARLLEWTIQVGDAEVLDNAAASLAGAGHPARREGRDVITSDPWGTPIRLTAHAGADRAGAPPVTRAKAGSSHAGS